ncbi:GNAT family N-acetyltransferase [Luedemannella flava]|uniref:GNAT family N-acetyltransferase n=1 Tax=Luedemannella flava TaxID=349316 RepID=A0ABN2LHW7_9ACTN
MTEARRAGPDDAAELTRLRVVMWAAMDGIAPEIGPWHAATVDRFRETLADPDGTWAAFVIDNPDQRPGLVSCAVGTIERRLPNPNNLTGDFGHIFNVATDPSYRRRGYSRACLIALLTWYSERGVPRVELNASKDGEPLYQQLGFARTGIPAMRCWVPPRPGAAPSTSVTV